MTDTKQTDVLRVATESLPMLKIAAALRDENGQISFHGSHLVNLIAAYEAAQEAALELPDTAPVGYVGCDDNGSNYPVGTIAHLSKPLASGSLLCAAPQPAIATLSTDYLVSELKNALKRIADLEAQLEAVGAGGVGTMLPRHAQPEPAVVGPVVAWRYQTPTGWHATTDAAAVMRIRAHHTVEPLYTSPQQIAEPEPCFYMSDDCAAGFAHGDTGGAWVTTVAGGTKNTPRYLTPPPQIAEPAPAVVEPVAIVAVSPGHVSVGWMGGYVPKHNDKLYAAPLPQQIAEPASPALKRIAEKLKRAGASVPAPENKGSIESAMATGLSIALLLVQDEIADATKEPS